MMIRISGTCGEFDNLSMATKNPSLWDEGKMIVRRYVGKGDEPRGRILVRVHTLELIPNTSGFLKSLVSKRMTAFQRCLKRAQVVAKRRLHPLLWCWLAIWFVGQRETK